MLKLEISIVVCHHKGTFVEKFVESVKKSLHVTYEVIVVTSNSDLALTGIKDCIVVYHEGMPAAKRNCGVRLSKADYIAFFDDDVEIEPLCLLNFLKSFDLTYAFCDRDKLGMVYGKLLKGDEPTRFDEAGGYLTKTGFM